jgi:HicA toxin of bacterial toxin-antitoxin,
MTKKQLRVLEGIFADPVRANLDWHDVESLLVALGAELTEARGSRVAVALNGVKAVFHEPHPEKEIGKGMVRSLRGFLNSAGVQAPD